MPSFNENQILQTPPFNYVTLEMIIPTGSLHPNSSHGIWFHSSYSLLLFKGDLAKYYDKNLSQVWWIETRPKEDVFERPAF